MIDNIYLPSVVPVCVHSCMYVYVDCVHCTVQYRELMEEDESNENMPEQLKVRQRPGVKFSFDICLFRFIYPVDVISLDIFLRR